MSIKSRVVILVGLPASGKSYLAKEYEKNADYVVINQDTQGSRITCEVLMKAALRAGLNVIIDRCNVSKKQRAPWIDIAKQYDARVECLLFIPHMNNSVANALAREHVNFPKEEKEIKTVIRRFYDEYQRPSLDEGYEHITYCYTYAGSE